MRLFVGVSDLSRAQLYSLFLSALFIEVTSALNLPSCQDCHTNRGTSKEMRDDALGHRSAESSLRSVIKRMDDGIFDTLSPFITDWHLVTPPYPHAVDPLPGEHGHHIPFVSDACPSISTAAGPQHSPLCIQINSPSPHASSSHPNANDVDGQRVWQATGKTGHHTPSVHFHAKQWRGNDPQQNIFVDHLFMTSGIGRIGRFRWSVAAHRPDELVLELDMYWPELEYAWRQVRGTTLLELRVDFEAHYHAEVQRAQRQGRITSPPLVAKRASSNHHESLPGPVSEGSWRFSLLDPGATSHDVPTSWALTFSTGLPHGHTESSGNHVDINSRFVIQWRAVALERGTERTTGYIYQPRRQHGTPIYPKNPKFYTPWGHKNPANHVPAPNDGYPHAGSSSQGQGKGKKPLHAPEPENHSADGTDWDDGTFAGLEPLQPLRLIGPPFPRRVDLLPGETSTHAPVVSSSCPTNNDYAHARPGSPLCLAVNAAQQQKIWNSIRNSVRFSVERWLSNLPPHTPSSTHRYYIHHPEVGQFGDFVWSWSAEEPGHVRLRAEIDWRQLRVLWEHARRTTLLEFQLEFAVYFAKGSGVRRGPGESSQISYADRSPITPLRTHSSWPSRLENDHVAFTGLWRFTESESLVGRQPYDRTLILDENVLREGTVVRQAERAKVARQVVIVLRIIAKEEGEVVRALPTHRWVRPGNGGPYTRPGSSRGTYRRPPYTKPTKPSAKRSLASSDHSARKSQTSAIKEIVIDNRSNAAGEAASGIVLDPESRLEPSSKVYGMRQFGVLPLLYPQLTSSGASSSSSPLAYRVSPMLGESAEHVPIVATSCPVIHESNTAPCIMFNPSRNTASAATNESPVQLFQRIGESTPLNLGLWLHTTSSEDIRQRRSAINVPGVGHIGTWVWQWDSESPRVITLVAEINMDIVAHAFLTARRTTVTSFLINFSAMYHSTNPDAERSAIPILLRSDMPNIGMGVLMVDPVGQWSFQQSLPHETNMDPSSRYLIYEVASIAARARRRGLFRQVSIQYRVVAVEVGDVRQGRIYRGPRVRDPQRRLSSHVRSRHQPPRGTERQDLSFTAYNILQQSPNPASLMHDSTVTSSPESFHAAAQEYHSRAETFLPLKTRSTKALDVGSEWSEGRLHKRQTHGRPSSSGGHSRNIGGHDGRPAHSPEAGPSHLPEAGPSHSTAPTTGCPSTSASPLCITVVPGSDQQHGPRVRAEYRSGHITASLGVGSMIRSIPNGEPRRLQFRTTINLPEIGQIGHWVFEWHPDMADRIFLWAHITPSSVRNAWSDAYANALVSFVIHYRLFQNTEREPRPLILPVTTSAHASDERVIPWTEFGTWSMLMTSETDASISDNFLVFDRSMLSVISPSHAGQFRRVRIRWEVEAVGLGPVRRSGQYRASTGSFWYRYNHASNRLPTEREAFHVPPENPP